MRKPPQFWHGVAWKGLSHRKQVPSALVWSTRVTRVSALPHRAQHASCVFMVLVYIRTAASLPLLRSGSGVRSRGGRGIICGSYRRSLLAGTTQPATAPDQPW